MKILSEIVKPHKLKNVDNKVNVVLNRIKNEIKNKNIDAEAMVGGSVAKGTFLRGYDCDIFVMFSMKYKDKSLSELLEKILCQFKHKERVHGSRDYFKFVYNGIDFEIIPVLKIKKAEEALNVTDVSPLHVKWVKKHIKSKADDIRLAKLFCKAQNVYGAESYINGFSGYMLEILVIHYNGFLNLLKAASKWKPKKVIDYSRFYKNQDDVLKKLNKAKLDSPLILVDPVQKDRNAAAALSDEKFNILKFASQKFLKNPSKKMFKVTPFSLHKLKDNAKNHNAELIYIEIVALEGKRDVVGGKILKCFNHLKKHLTLNEFEIIESGWDWKEGEIAKLWYIVYPIKLPKTMIHKGPLVTSKKEDVERFIKKHKSYKIDNNRIFSEVKRKYLTPKSLVKDLIKNYFKERVKKTKVLKV